MRLRRSHCETRRPGRRCHDETSQKSAQRQQKDSRPAQRQGHPKEAEYQPVHQDAQRHDAGERGGESSQPTGVRVLTPGTVEPCCNNLTKTENHEKRRQQRPQKTHRLIPSGRSESWVQLIERRLHQALPHFSQRMRAYVIAIAPPVHHGITAQQERDDEPGQGAKSHNVQDGFPCAPAYRPRRNGQKHRQAGKRERIIRRERQPQRQRCQYTGLAQ
jgi:hypothetical protein